MEYYIVYFVSALVWSFVWGFATKKVNENKGYYGGFWWGCFLGFIGLIIVMSKPDNNYYSRQPDAYSSPSEISEYDRRIKAMANEKILEKGGWKCVKCDRINADYVTTCICGVHKGENFLPPPEPVKLPPPPAQAELPSVTEAEQIEKYKKLCDDGLITQEEFDAKRKQILGL